MTTTLRNSVLLAAMAVAGCTGRVETALEQLLEARSLSADMAVNADIVVLSRRNSNVRSLALSLGQKRELTAQCEATLRALQEALAKRGFGGSR